MILVVRDAWVLNRSERPITPDDREDGFIPIISKLPGFVSYMIVDAGPGVAASISIFGSEHDAERSTAAAAKWVKESLADVIRKGPERTTGEIVLAAPTCPAW